MLHLAFFKINRDHLLAAVAAAQDGEPKGGVRQ